MSGVMAKLCQNCGFGPAGENCISCGQWTANDPIMAKLCQNCGFGPAGDNCISCGQWVG